MRFSPEEASVGLCEVLSLLCSEQHKWGCGRKYPQNLGELCAMLQTHYGWVTPCVFMLIWVYWPFKRCHWALELLFAERLSDLQLHSLLSMNHLVKYRQFICCNDGSSCDSTYLDKYSLHGAFYLSSLWCWCPHSLVFSCPWGGWLVFKHKAACQPLIYPTFCFSLKLQDYKCIILI